MSVDTSMAKKEDKTSVMVTITADAGTPSTDPGIGVCSESAIMGRSVGHVERKKGTASRVDQSSKRRLGAEGTGNNASYGIGKAGSGSGRAVHDQLNLDNGEGGDHPPAYESLPTATTQAQAQPIDPIEGHYQRRIHCAPDDDEASSQPRGGAGPSPPYRVVEESEKSGGKERGDETGKERRDVPTVPEGNEGPYAWNLSDLSRTLLVNIRRWGRKVLDRASASAEPVGHHHDKRWCDRTEEEDDR